LFNKFITTREYNEELKRQKRKILSDVNDITLTSYQSALTVGLQTRATALSKSDNMEIKQTIPMLIPPENNRK
jgi:hypothetical protein